MASFRRSMILVQRDGTVTVAQNGEESRDDSSSPKLYYNRTYLAFRRYLSLLRNSLNLLMMLDRMQAAICRIFWQRSSRSVERSRQKGQYWKKAFSYFFICFIAGFFIGFTPFLSVDISKNFTSKHQAFSFDNDLTVEDARYKMVRNEVSFLTKSVRKDNASLYPPAGQEMKNENLDASYVPSSIQDPEWYEKLLIIVTPTYTRPFQAYYLNRLAHILANLPPPLLWIVVEMSSQSPETAQILRETTVMYRHLVCKQNATSVKDSRVHQRNVAIAHIEKHHLDGIVYFADDDRTYSVDVFHQMRKIRRFGTWPVATLIGSRKRVILEGPICNGSQVIGWHTSQRNKISRRFHVDMSGFAFNSTILWDPKRWHRPTLESIRQRDSVRESLRESTFIEQLVEDERQMEGLPENCSKIMVWHLHLEAPELFYPHGWLLQRNLEVVAPLT